MNVFSIPYPGHEQYDILIPIVSLAVLFGWYVISLMIDIFRRLK